MWSAVCSGGVRNVCSLIRVYKQSCVYHYPLYNLTTHTGCVPNPPWRVLFFGSDEFAVEALRRLHDSRSCVADGAAVVDSLEVVTLSRHVPVHKFAERHELRVHEWPHVEVSGRFDVGVVVSFGCLLQESLINKLPYGILNVHPSLLPRWRGPAPVFHTILQGDRLTGVTIMQIRPKRFDVGPILSQELYEVPERCTADELGSSLAVLGAQLLIDTLRNLPERIKNRREQAKEGATFAPKISASLSCIVWETQTCDQIDRLYCAIGSRVPLRTIWMGRPIKLLDFVGKCQDSLTDGTHSFMTPGSIHCQKDSNTLMVRCKDGWVGFKAVMLKKRLSAVDFYNGYLHQSVLKKVQSEENCRFQSYSGELRASSKGQNFTKLQSNRRPASTS